MEIKYNSSVGSRAQDTAYKGLSFEDKYFAATFEIQKLKRQRDKLCDALIDWRERALFLQGERDHYRGRNFD
jgi:hypothetical protein